MHLFLSTRTLRRAIVALLALALSAHGFAPDAKAAKIAPEDLSLEQALHVICSASGNRGLGQEAPPKRPGEMCPLCPAFTGPAVAAPVVVALSQPQWTRFERALPAAFETRYTTPRRRFQARAPPIGSFA